MRWIVGIIELRKRGAIGKFTPHQCRTQADSFEKAIDYLIDDAHAYGFEPLIITNLRAVTKAEYDLVPKNVWDSMEEPS